MARLAKHFRKVPLALIAENIISAYVPIMSHAMTTAEAGRLGGLRSRRHLSPDAARAMVRVREARRLYRAYYDTCFWWAQLDLRISAADVAWVADGLRKHGGRAAWRAAARLERPYADPVGSTGLETSAAVPCP